MHDPIADLLHRPAWQRDALCVEYPDVEFFPERGQPVDPAKDVCARCLVRDECLDYATALDLDGVWGGLTRRRRQALRRPAA